jgi:hypothetical protein
VGATSSCLVRLVPFSPYSPPAAEHTTGTPNSYVDHRWTGATWVVLLPKGDFRSLDNEPEALRGVICDGWSSARLTLPRKPPSGHAPSVPERRGQRHDMSLIQLQVAEVSRSVSLSPLGASGGAVLAGSSRRGIVVRALIKCVRRPRHAKHPQRALDSEDAS